MNSFLTILKTELKLTLRSIDMVLFAVLMPVVVLLVVGLIYGNGTPGGDSGASTGMINQTFGAFLSIGICAVGLMGLPLVLAEYRHRKVLKRFQVTPVHPGVLLAVQLVTQSIVAIFSAVLVTVTALTVFQLQVSGSVWMLAGSFLLVLVSIFSLGLMIASTARDVRRAGVIASIAYFPMLIFSGATVPFSVFPDGVQMVTAILPLRHGIALLNGVAQGNGALGFLPEIGVLLGVAVVGIAVSIRSFRWEMD